MAAEKIVAVLGARAQMISAAESCTAGLASDFIARISGASKVFWGSFITYAIDAKVKMLGVPKELIEKNGAVSRPVAIAMAEGALKKSGVFWAFSVTGLAGPDGDGSENPVGTVWIGLSRRDAKDGAKLRSCAKKFLFSGSRNEVREAAATAALEELLELINQELY